jgi:hypothetical protein
MDAVLFLILALGLIAIGMIVIALRHREPKREDAITSFQKEMRALSPEARRATDSRLRPLPRQPGPTGPTGE